MFDASALHALNLLSLGLKALVILDPRGFVPAASQLTPDAMGEV